MSGGAPVFWRDELVGHLTNIETDMWYWEADWQPVPELDLSVFYQELAKLPPLTKETWASNQNMMIWIGIFHNHPTHVVMEFDNDRITARFVVSAPKDWESN